MSNQSQNTETLPTTPDWSKAPEGYDYFAINKDGAGYFSKKIPCKHSTYWESYGKEMCAGNFDSSNWENSRQQRPKIEGVNGTWGTGEKVLSKPPKIETLTVQLNTDISGYLAGKNSFITGLVDLLLARMAKKECWSDDDDVVAFFEPFDVITFDSSNDSRKNYAVIDIASPTPIGRIEICHNIIKHKDGWLLLGTDTLNNRQFNFRTITELEAVEFRKAMEAVYG